MPHVEWELAACHSVGMLLQTYGLADPDVEFLSYNSVHPLEHKIVVKLATRAGAAPAVVLRRVLGRVEEDLCRVEAGVLQSHVDVELVA